MLIQFFFLAVEPFLLRLHTVYTRIFFACGLLPKNITFSSEHNGRQNCGPPVSFFTPLTPVVNVGTHGHPTLTLGKGVKNDGIIHL